MLASLRIETSLWLDIFTRTDCCHRLLTPVASLYLRSLTTAIKIMKEPSSLDNGLQLRERAMWSVKDFKGKLKIIDLFFNTTLSLNFHWSK